MSTIPAAGMCNAYVSLLPQKLAFALLKNTTAGRDFRTVNPDREFFNRKRARDKAARSRYFKDRLYMRQIRLKFVKDPPTQRPIT